MRWDAAEPKLEESHDRVVKKWYHTDENIDSAHEIGMNDGRVKVYSEVFGSGSVPAARGAPEGGSMSSLLASSRQRLKRQRKRLIYIVDI